jgi:hypothetical protein
VSSQQKYRIFISSTYTDLVAERQAVMLSLLKLGHFPVGMELYPTEDNDLWSIIQQQINECDYYMVLVGGRYGSLSPMGLSYTHREYIYASTRKKPILSLVHDDPSLLPASRREESSIGEMRLDSFRQLLAKGDMSREWHTRAELFDLVGTVVPQFISRHPVEGWVRNGTQVASLEVTRLQKQVEELERELEALRVGGGRPPSAPFPQHEYLDVRYRCNVFVKGNCKLTDLTEHLTWGELFVHLGSQMLDKISDNLMRQTLEKWLAAKAMASAQKIHAHAHAITSVQISPENFNQIKVRLRVLGLISKGSQVMGGAPNWQLTPYGTEILNQLLVRASHR